MATTPRKWQFSMLPKGANASERIPRNLAEASDDWRKPRSSPSSDLAGTLANVSPGQRGEEKSSTSATRKKPDRRSLSSPPTPGINILESPEYRPGFDGGEGLEAGDEGQSDDEQGSDSDDDSIGNQFALDGDPGTGIDAGAGKDVGQDMRKLPPVTETEFYSNLVFLSILRPKVGPHKRRSRDLEFVDMAGPTPSPPPAQIELQRDFLDRLCYLADFRKGGDTVTAAAIEFYRLPRRPGVGGGSAQEQQRLQSQPQQLQQTQVIWFAANAGVSKEAWEALLEVQRLINENRTEGWAEEWLAREICDKFASLAACREQGCCSRKNKQRTSRGTHRINYYAKFIKKHGNRVCELLDRRKIADQSDLAPIKNWIKDLQGIRTPVGLVMACYNCWFEEPYRSFLKQATDASSSEPEFTAELKDFAHFVARLGAHQYAALRVAAAIKRLPYFGSNRNCWVKFDSLPKPYHISLEPVPVSLASAFVSPAPDGAETDPPCSTPWNIIHRLGQYFPGDGPKLAAGYYLEECRRGQPGSATVFSFHNEVQRWLSNKKGVLLTRQHAELQVANFFNAGRVPFQDHDRYIGCSKGACWFCFQYLANLRPTTTRPGAAADDGFVEPSCHNEVLPGVRFPQSKTDKSRSMMDDMRALLNDIVLRTIRDALLGNVQEFEKRYQSTDTWMDRTVYEPSSWMQEEDIRSVAPF
ncbi:a27281ea-71a0-4409-812d-ab6f02bf35bb [Thermothielavioides terrestris]|uniref:Uncharacterized protein n=2 Tax=Thermothielavioides terrestris TaxID=2587410 RepID=G2QQV4_THETT|nr:uncharacterized protein THITE_2126511 [Thermothielavioides terrestris NRRL 8126]AEO64113.1 hypothetical protein THITE_2126511 [Thermothielavioides terrestris NRRL 8126]SPQ27032.1 a27281ea-71a0-4409-812d-ab6f02bf35bb [Thermothielavioides terrestris]